MPFPFRVFRVFRGLSLFAAQSPYQLSEPFSPLAEIAELVVARTTGREDDRVAGLGVFPTPIEGVFERRHGDREAIDVRGLQPIVQFGTNLAEKRGSYGQSPNRLDHLVEIEPLVMPAGQQKRRPADRFQRGNRRFGRGGRRIIVERRGPRSGRSAPFAAAGRGTIAARGRSQSRLHPAARAAVAAQAAFMRLCQPGTCSPGNSSSATSGSKRPRTRRSHEASRRSCVLSTARSSGRCRWSRICLAAAYSSMLACQSRWFGEKLVITLICGSRVSGRRYES